MNDLKKHIEKLQKEVETLKEQKENARTYLDRHYYSATLDRLLIEVDDLKQLSCKPTPGAIADVCVHKDVCKIIAENGCCNLKCGHFLNSKHHWVEAELPITIYKVNSKF